MPRFVTVVLSILFSLVTLLLQDEAYGATLEEDGSERCISDQTLANEAGYDPCASETQEYDQSQQTGTPTQTFDPEADKLGRGVVAIGFSDAVKDLSESVGTDPTNGNETGRLKTFWEESFKN